MGEGSDERLKPEMSGRAVTGAGRLSAASPERRGVFPQQDLL